MIKHLRAVTRPAHDALEGTLGLMDEQLGIDTYKDILGRFYGFWSGWQPQVSTLFRDEQFLGPRRRLHLLAADLAALGVSTPIMEALPICPLVLLSDDVEALGSLYVMEGSTLGGRIIRRNVERCLGDEGRASCSYFNGYGGETSTMWLSFLARLAERPHSEAERAGRGAVATFERLAWWLTDGHRGGSTKEAR